MDNPFRFLELSPEHNTANFNKAVNVSNPGGIAGHYIIDVPSVHFYSGSKHAVTVLTEGLRRELVALSSHIRVTRTGPTQLSHQSHGELYKRLTEGLRRKLVALNSHIRVTRTCPTQLSHQSHGEFYKRLTDGLSIELVQLNSHIRVTSISPGAVNTEIMEAIDPVRGKEMKEQIMIKNIPILNSKDIADAVLYTLATPPHVQNVTEGAQEKVVYSNPMTSLMLTDSSQLTADDFEKLPDQIMIVDDEKNEGMMSTGEAICGLDTSTEVKEINGMVSTGKAICGLDTSTEVKEINVSWFLVSSSNVDV
uniref:Uncharacterized protein n=1 Tax=Timema cristinae TaxID=61476 RepID=A0A7R9H807_TIMCR|nr:unnamed protein product [Timema cristinae]